MDLVLTFTEVDDLLAELRRCPPDDGIIRVQAIGRKLGTPGVEAVSLVATCVCGSRLLRFRHECGPALVTESRNGTDRIGRRTYAVIVRIGKAIVDGAKRLGLKVERGIWIPTREER